MADHKISFVLTDIDDTLTENGKLGPEAYQTLWNLKNNGVHVIPITGRPAGWCEMIARTWPVSAVVGENGAFYFLYDEKSKTMKRHFATSKEERAQQKQNLKTIEEEILQKVPQAALASDQFCRIADLAIDFCEDVPPLSQQQIDQIVEVFQKHGAQAKVSSIHINGWFGQYDKLTTTLKLLEQEFSISTKQAKEQCAFSGDSPNDEPMFAFFPHSYAVANIKPFLTQIENPPTHIVHKEGGAGFVEIIEKIFPNL